MAKLVMMVGRAEAKLDVQWPTSELSVMMAIDRGSEVHTAPRRFPWQSSGWDSSAIRLAGVQGQPLKVYGTAVLDFKVQDKTGELIDVATRFVISDTVKFVLSMGELAVHGWSCLLGELPRLEHSNSAVVPLVRQGNTFYLQARLGWLGDSPWPPMVATATAMEEETPGAASSSSAVSPLMLPPLPPGLPAPAGAEAVPQQVAERPVLSAWSSVGALKGRLKALGGPVYGTKDELWKRLCEWEAIAEKQVRERQWIEARKKAMIDGALPVAAELPVAPELPTDPAEIERHEATHIPPMPWC